MDEQNHSGNSSEQTNETQNLNKNENRSYEFDDLLRLTGGFGRYQVALYTFICLVSIPTGAQLSIPVFYAISPRFICTSMFGNGTCPAGKCCSSCVEYEFKGPFTSAVSEVRETKRFIYCVFIDISFSGRSGRNKTSSCILTGSCFTILEN